MGDLPLLLAANERLLLWTSLHEFEMKLKRRSPCCASVLVSQGIPNCRPSSPQRYSSCFCPPLPPSQTTYLRCTLLFGSGHCKLARQMTLLMAFCDYLGNSIKDLVSAPRPSSPPVRRVTTTKDEKENAAEYGLPSSHTLNTVCLSGYLVHYVISYTQNKDAAFVLAGVAMACLLVGLIGLGRIYLGMHSLVDVLGGLAIGLLILAFWLTFHAYVDNLIVSEQNVISFWVALSFLLLFAYPTPEFPTPSFEYHTAFNGVALGIEILRNSVTSIFPSNLTNKVNQRMVSKQMLCF